MPNQIEYGRECYDRGTWSEAYVALRDADRVTPLDGDDLELLGFSAYLIGQTLEFERHFERLQREQMEMGNRERSARSAFWLSMSLLLRGEIAQSNAWIARAHRLVGHVDCAERGYLLLQPAERQLRDGQFDLAFEKASTAWAIGDRFGDIELAAMARHLQGRALLEQNRVAAGLELFDETMLPVVAGELSPIVSGLLYCSVLAACRTVYSLGRAREWTSAFSGWCERRPDALAFSGACLINRAELLCFQGAWPDAFTVVDRACERAVRLNRQPPAAALYQRAELHRLRGEHAEAEEAYRAASLQGYDPQPGLSLLRLVQGQVDAAYAAIRRTVCAIVAPADRARVLPAAIEIVLANGELNEAYEACAELQELAVMLDADALRASAAHAAGIIELAAGRADVALGPLRRAFELWTSLDAPYDAARARISIALGCRALGDDETCAMELASARATFEVLSARDDLKRLDALEPHRLAARKGKLSPREHEVLQLLAAGNTNKAIAGQLFISERTVDRHVSNILTKLDVRSRTAAASSAYRHKLL
jgi:DNA-binding CsgD family transcriptional regulator